MYCLCFALYFLQLHKTKFPPPTAHSYYQINVKKGGHYLIQIAPERPKSRFFKSLFSGAITGTGTLLSTSSDNEKLTIRSEKLQKNNQFPALAIGATITVPHIIGKSRLKRQKVYYQVLAFDNSNTQLMYKSLKNGRTEIKGIAEEAGVLTIILPNGVNAIIHAEVEIPKDGNGSEGGGEEEVEDEILLPDYSITYGDSLDNGGGSYWGGTFEPIVITGVNNPCLDNPFLCGCPFQSPSCLEPQPIDIDLTMPSSGDPCVGNPCLCGNCGGSTQEPDIDDIMAEMPNLNSCEIAYAILNPLKASAAYSATKAIDHMFSTNDSLLFAGGQTDHTRANAMKHFLWNIVRFCNSRLSISDVATIAQNHEYCGGPLSPTEVYAMDTYNNAQGQYYANQIVSEGKCKDEGALIYFAFFEA